MYHSIHNNDITYFFTWGKPVRIEGNGAVCKEDTDIGKDNWTQEYINLHFTEGITEIKQGFLESFRILKTLIFDRSVNNIDMTYQPQSLSTNYTSILATINDVEGFDETVEEITTLGSRQSSGYYYCRSCKNFYSDGQLVEGACPTENCDSMIISAYFDNLDTISADEIKQLILIKPESEDYIDTIRAAFNAYSIEVEKDGENYTITVTPVTTGDYDRELSTDDISGLKAQLNENMESNDSKYTHISLDQISDAEVDSFGMLTHFTALKEISFRGTSATYLFESNSSANGTFGVVALGCETVEKVTMNYCGLSDV